MKVILAEHAGFCFGVKRAINMTSETALKVTDATCPFVKKAQKLAAKLAGEGYNVVILGEAHHPEVKGILGYTNNRAVVVGNPKEVRKIKKCSKLGVVVQTTQPMQNFLDTVFALRDKSPEIRVFNTICDATRKRQDSALKLANKVDIMIVVGGKNSANTKHLAELCREKRVPTYHIEGALEIKKSWFKGKKLAGVTAGASTPDWIIKSVIKTITAPDYRKNQSKPGQNNKS